MGGGVDTGGGERAFDTQKSGPEARQTKPNKNGRYHSSLWRDVGIFASGAALAGIIAGPLAYKRGVESAESVRDKLLDATLVMARTTDLEEVVDTIKPGDNGHIMAELSLEPGNPAACKYNFTVRNEEGSLYVQLDARGSQFAGNERQANSRQEAEAILEDVNRLFPCDQPEPAN